VLEVWQSGDPIGELCAYLDAHGFFAAGADGIVADVFLAYGASDGLRRLPFQAPPEPCPLPLAACRIRPARSRTKAPSRAPPER